jgi:hypothetical protein
MCSLPCAKARKGTTPPRGISSSYAVQVCRRTSATIVVCGSNGQGRGKLEAEPAASKSTVRAPHLRIFHRQIRVHNFKTESCHRVEHLHPFVLMHAAEHSRSRRRSRARCLATCLDESFFFGGGCLFGGGVGGLIDHGT